MYQFTEILLTNVINDHFYQISQIIPVKIKIKYMYIKETRRSYSDVCLNRKQHLLTSFISRTVKAPSDILAVSQKYCIYILFLYKVVLKLN